LDSDPREAGSLSCRRDGLILTAAGTGQRSEIPWQLVDEVGIRSGELGFAISIAPPLSYFVVAEPQTAEEHDRWLAIFTRHDVPLLS
jgi:hypothetical protein